MKTPLFTFTPQIEVLMGLRGSAPVQAIESEPMLFSASPEFAAQNGGVITQRVMKNIMSEVRQLAETADPKYKYLVIDTRSHMLMPGMYPAIPGWHCDCVPRSTYTAQPDLDKSSCDQLNFCVLIGSEPDIAPTDFLVSPISLYYDPARVWSSISDGLELIKDTLNISPALQGSVLMFNGQTLHRATPAISRGWRFFFRCSTMQHPPQNKIRHQVQVYTTGSAGW